MEERGSTVPQSGSAPASPLRLDALNNLAGELVRTERDHYLIESDFIEDLLARVLQPPRESLGMATGTLNEVGEARWSRCRPKAEGAIDMNPARRGPWRRSNGREI